MIRGPLHRPDEADCDAMSLLRRRRRWFVVLLARTLALAFVVMLFAAACVAPGILYIESPKFALEGVDRGAVPSSFPVAIRTPDPSADEAAALEVLPWEPYQRRGSPDPALEAGHYHFSRGAGGGSANIEVKEIAEGRLRVRIHQIGDTPWAAVSDYEVVDGTVHPLRHGRSMAWLLPGVIVLPLLVLALSGRAFRAAEASTYRLLGEHEWSGEPP